MVQLELGKLKVGFFRVRKNVKGDTSLLTFCSLALVLLSEYNAHLSSHVPQRAEQPCPSVPSQVGRPDVDACHLEPHAQSLPQPRRGQSQREAWLGGRVYGTSYHDGFAHSRGKQVSPGGLNICLA